MDPESLDWVLEGASLFFGGMGMLSWNSKFLYSSNELIVDKGLIFQ